MVSLASTAAFQQVLPKGNATHEPQTPVVLLLLFEQLNFRYTQKVIKYKFHSKQSYNIGMIILKMFLLQ